MMSVEYREARERVDEFLARPNAREDHLTVDTKKVEEAKRLIRGPEGKPVDRAEAYRWINCRERVLLGRIAFGLFGSFLAKPIVVLEQLYVYTRDGSPTIHFLPVGFLGDGNRFEGVVMMPKVRTLPVGAEEAEIPFMSALFRPKNGDGTASDGRPFSIMAGRFRQWSIDELPELSAIRRGVVDAFGGRGLYKNEARDAAYLYIVDDHDGDILPTDVPSDCRAVVTEVRPRQSLIGPYSALGRKDLNFATRQTLNYLMMTEANLAGDLRLLAETVRKLTKKVGAG